MTLQTISDPESLARLGKLARWFDESSQDWYCEAAECHAQGEYALAQRMEDEGAIAARAAQRVRDRLAAASGLTVEDVAVGLSDAMARGPLDTAWLPPTPYPRRVAVQTPEHLTPEPPATLVALVGWLRRLLESRFPGVPSEVWQGIAAALLQGRRP